MKKLLFLFFHFIIAIGCNAQRIAVLEFSAGVGVSLGDVDGLSSIFTTYFRPANYTVVERTEIDRIIDEHSFQRSSITEAQMVRIGKILNLSKVVVGKINIIAGEYNVDVRVIDVESGVIVTTDGASFPQGSYRKNMEKLAVSLASNLSPENNMTQSIITNQTSLPQSLVAKLKRFPDAFDVAVMYDKNLYFVSETNLPELLSYPTELYSIIAIMFKGGENAVGIGQVNSIDACSSELASRMIGMLPNNQIGSLILRDIVHINNIIRKIGGQPMESEYWMEIAGNDFLGILSVPNNKFESATSQNNFFIGQKYLVRLVWSLSDLRQAVESW